MQGAIRSTSSSTSQARSGGTGTVKEWSSSMLISESLFSGWIQSVNYARYRCASAKTPTVWPGDLRRRGRGSGGAQDLEAFGQPAVERAGQPSRAGQPGAQELGHIIPVAGLALMGAQGRDLTRERIGHIHVVIWRRAARDPDLADSPGGQGLLLTEFGERERIARVRVDGVQRGGAHRAVVGVARSGPGVIPLGTWAYDPIRADLPDHPGQILAQFQGGLDPAVRVAEEAHVLDADAFRRGDLLGLAQAGHLGAREVLVEAARVAVGHHAVDDLDPGVGPARHRSGGTEVNVVRVRGDRKH